MTQPRYTLYGTPLTRAFRVLWALEELGAPYSLLDVTPQSESIRAVNPAGKVPALVDHSADESVITDSVAIIQYLADVHQELTHPAGTIQRAEQDSLTQFACDELDGTLWWVARHTFVLPEDMRALDAVKPGAAREFKRAMDSLAPRLTGRQYATGEHFTVADIVITHCLMWANRSGFAIDAEGIEAYLQRTMERAAFKRSMAIREAGNDRA